MTDADTDRLKRLKIRAWRRGIKEMDLILGQYVDDCGAALDAAQLDALEALMEESDLDLYSWVTGRAEPPAAHAESLSRITSYALRK